MDGEVRLRADAQRNRARLLEVAQSAFASRGTEASLDDIARRAGVGVGTLYRHFPTRDDLVESLIHSEVVRLVELSRELASSSDPLAALRTWLRAFVRHAMAFRGLAEALVAAAGAENRLGAACHDTEDAGRAVFDRAQSLGVVRPDVTLEDTLELAASIAWVVEQSGRDAADHLLDVALDGLRHHP